MDHHKIKTSCNTTCITILLFRPKRGSTSFGFFNSILPWIFEESKDLNVVF